MAWGVILVVTALIALGVAADKADSSNVVDAAEAKQEQGWGTLELQCRLALGQHALMPSQSQNLVQSLVDVARVQAGGMVRVSTVVAAIDGPKAAADLLRSWVVERRSLTGPLPLAQVDMLDLFERLYDGTASEAQRQTITEQYGWFGTVALAATQDAPEKRAAQLKALMSVASQRVLLAFIGILVWAFAGVIGITLLVIYIVRYISGRVPCALEARSFHDGLYAETFAIWLLLFQGLLLAGAALGKLMPESMVLVPTLIMFPVSLVVLLWPRIRGVPLAQIRCDIGWTTGKGILLECWAGLMGYLMAMPILVVGLMLTTILMWLAGPGDAAHGSAHPVIGLLQSDNWWMRGQVLLLAVVLAPLVEETLFRGVLYRQLRLAPKWRAGVSMLLSAVVTGVIFALIHPQGVLAVPALASLAVAFALAREWRGSLIAPMIMHGVSNGLTLIFVLMLLG